MGDHWERMMVEAGLLPAGAGARSKEQQLRVADRRRLGEDRLLAGMMRRLIAIGVLVPGENLLIHGDFEGDAIPISDEEQAVIVTIIEEQ